MSGIDKILEKTIGELSRNEQVRTSFENWLRAYYKRADIIDISLLLEMGTCNVTGRPMYINFATEVAFNAYLAGSIATMVELKLGAFGRDTNNA